MSGFEIGKANEAIGAAVAAIASVGDITRRSATIGERIAYAQAQATMACAWLNLHGIRESTTAADLGVLQLAARMAVGDLDRGTDPRRVAAGLRQVLADQDLT